MALPIYDCAVRTSVVASGGALVQLVPPTGAVGTGRMVRLRQVSISNTTATGFGVGLGIATAAAVTPATAGTIVRRSTPSIDAAPISLVWTTFATTPTAPSGYSARLWVPGNSMVVWVFNEGEELLVPPAATPLPFCVFNTGTGQVADVTLTWEE
jgi:hypothetical protein